MAQNPSILGLALSSLSIDSDSASDTFPVYVQLMDGRKTKLNVKGSWTVKQLKTEFGKYHGIHCENIKLVYKAKHMTDEKLLQDYKVIADSIIISTERSTGGE